MEQSVKEHIVNVFNRNLDATWESLDVNYPLSSSAFERMKSGHECTMPEDRWAMALAGGYFYIVRWTGIPIFRLKIDENEHGAAVTSITVNSNKSHVNFKSENDVIKALRELLIDFLNIDLAEICK